MMVSSRRFKSARQRKDASSKTAVKLVLGNELFSTGTAHELAIFTTCNGKMCTFTTRTFDLPISTSLHDMHLAPLPPPLVDFSWKCDPHIFISSEVRQ